MKAGQWKEPVADLFACSPADVRTRHGPVLEPLTTGDDECRGMSRRSTRIARDAKAVKGLAVPCDAIMKEFFPVAHSIGIDIGRLSLHE